MISLLTPCQLTPRLRAPMSYIAERRLEEKERRRGEILDAVEAVAAERGWDAMTMDEVARKARLSRALVYVYFKDKTDLLFGVGERGLGTLRRLFVESAAHHDRGIDQVTAMGRAYVRFSREFPVYFAVLVRCELTSPDMPQPGTNENACMLAGDGVHEVLVTSIATGLRDGSIRSDAGNPHAIAVVLWGFMHGVIQLAASKANVLAHRGLAAQDLLEQALAQATVSIAARPPK
jgi:TetR/AcrR family transcriptional regulator